MNSEWSVWAQCAHLIRSECYDQAVQMLEQRSCAMALVFMGQIHLAKAEKIINSFTFRVYPTKEMQENLHKLLMDTYGFYFEASAKNDFAIPEERVYVLDQVKYALDKLDDMLLACQVEPRPKEEFDVMEDEDLRFHTENLIGSIAELNFIDGTCSAVKE